MCRLKNYIIVYIGKFKNVIVLSMWWRKFVFLLGFYVLVW